MTLHRDWIRIPAADDRSFEGYLALPPAGRGPGIVLLQEIFGVNPHIRGVARQYAQDGYVVLAPDLFWRQQPRVELGYEGADWQRAKALKAASQLDDVEDDIARALAALRGRPEVTGGIGVLGYCFGGLLAFLTAARGEVDAASCYYGGGTAEHLERAANIRCPIQLHFGERDGVLPPAAVSRIRFALESRAKAEIHVYEGADHGFNCWDRAAYHQRSAAIAHGRSLMLFGRHL